MNLEPSYCFDPYGGKAVFRIEDWLENGEVDSRGKCRRKAIHLHMQVLKAFQMKEAVKREV